MENTSKENFMLINAITDAVESLRQLQLRLIAVQQQAEDLYLKGEEGEEHCR